MNRPGATGPMDTGLDASKGLSQQSMPKLQIWLGLIKEWSDLVPWQSASFATKTWVCPVTGSSQAVAPDTTGTFKRGLIDSSQACPSTCSVVNSRMVKLLPRQHVSLSESVLLADSFPGWGWDVALDELELEFTNRADE